MASPKLRFKEFDGDFLEKTIKTIAQIYVGRDLVEKAYSPIKTEQHVYPIYSNSIDNEGLYGYYNFEEFNFLDDALTVVGRGAGLGKAFYRQGGFGTIGRLLCLTPKDKSFHPKYLSDYINDKLVIHNESGGIPQLPRSSLEGYEVTLPEYEEQTKIASFLSAVDEKISQLTQKYELLSQYKQGMMQKLFSQQIRFKAEDGSEFGEWDIVPLSHYLYTSKVKNRDLKYSKLDVLSVSGELGIVNQIELLGRSYAGVSVAPYGVVENGDIVYTKSPLKSNPYGIIKVNKGKAGIVSTLYAIYKCKENICPELIEYYFQSDLKLNHFLKPLVKKGAKNDMKVNNDHVLTGQVSFPSSLEEQSKIVNFLSAIDQKIEVVAQQIEQAKQWKRGLLQQMFV